MITLLLPVCVGMCVTAAVLVHGPLRRRAFDRAVTRLRRPGTAPDRSLAKISEVVRLRLAAALLDLGNHLMLSAEEHRAFRLRSSFTSARARRLGVAAAAVGAGARRLDEVTLEIPIGERAQEGHPKRTLALSCVVYGVRPTAARATDRRTYPRSSGASRTGPRPDTAAPPSRSTY